MTNASLDDLVALQTEKIFVNKDPKLPYIGLEHMAQGEPRLLGTANSSSSISVNAVFKKGDILFGKLRPNLRKSIKAPFDGYCSTDILVLRSQDGVVPGFSAHIFQWERVFSAAVATAAGTKMPRTSWSDLKRFKVFKPESDQEQTRIAYVLDTIDEAIARTEAVIAKLKQVRAGMLHDLLSYGLDEHGQLRDPVAHPEQFKESLLGLIPREWDVVRLVDRAGVFGGKRLPSGHSYADLPTGYRYLRVLDFFERSIAYDELAILRKDTFAALSRYEIHDGELFISIAGSLGFVGVLRPETTERYILTENAARISILRDLIPEFLSLYMNGVAVQKQINAEKGIGAGVPKLALHRIERLWVAQPKPAEQETIVSITAQFDRQLGAELIELRKLESLKSGLQDDLLTGRVRVPETIMEGAENA